MSVVEVKKAVRVIPTYPSNARKLLSREFGEYVYKPT
jgi:hypothetical protein